MDNGFRRERFRVILACDNFDPAVRSYNFNAKRRTARVVDLNTTTPDMIIKFIENRSSPVRPEGVLGGPPCQGFSRGNAQADPQDPRNLLPFRYAEILASLNRRYALKFFVFENVLGLTNPRHVARYRAICRAFQNAGFNLFQGELDAQDFGVAQLRRRLFVVGLNRELFPHTEFQFPSGSRDRVTVREVIAGLPPPTFFKQDLTPSEIAFHPNHWTMQPKSEKLRGASPTDGRSFRRLSWDEVSPTVAYGNREIHVHPDGGRRLSVFEAMLLQGFPRSYRLSGNFSQQITQVSNAVPPPLAQALARRLQETIREHAEG
jgi:DNA (cytosine-5)-methyltransferase 1